MFTGFEHAGIASPEPQKLASGGQLHGARSEDARSTPARSAGVVVRFGALVVLPPQAASTASAATRSARMSSTLARALARGVAPTHTRAATGPSKGSPRVGISQHPPRR